MPARIKRDDTVVVIGGKDRGKRGRVLRVEPKKNRVYVEGLNMVKRHEKPRQVTDSTKAATVGGVIEKEGPIHVSNVMLAEPSTGQPTRVGIEVHEGKRYRMARRTGKRID